MNPRVPEHLPTRRRFAQGAELGDDGVHFRVWAPTHH